MSKVKSISLNNESSENFVVNGVGNTVKTTNRYNGVSSQAMIESLEESGLVVRSISKPRARLKENLIFNKHIIRMTTPDNMALLDSKKVGLSIPEIVVLNNNNNRGAIQVMLGVFRLVCSNGMILGDTFYSGRVTHRGNTAEHLLNTLIDARENFERVNEVIADLQNTFLTSSDALSYKREVITPILEKRLKRDNTILLNIDKRFNPQRVEDQNSDLYTLFNRCQEYLLRGGVKYTRIDEVKNKHGDTVENKLTNTVTRAVNSVDKITLLNKEIFDRTLEFFKAVA